MWSQLPGTLVTVLEYNQALTCTLHPPYHCAVYGLPTCTPGQLPFPSEPLKPREGTEETITLPIVFPVVF